MAHGAKDIVLVLNLPPEVEPGWYPHPSDMPNGPLLDRSDFGGPRVTNFDQDTPEPSEAFVSLSYGPCKEIKFGRHPDLVNVRLSGIGISRHHFTLRLGEHGIWTVICHSKNGIYVNEEKLHPEQGHDRRVLKPLEWNKIHVLQFGVINAYPKCLPWHSENFPRRSFDCSLVAGLVAPPHSAGNDTASVSSALHANLTEDGAAKRTPSEYISLDQPHGRNLPWPEGFLAIEARTAGPCAITKFPTGQYVNLLSFFIRFQAGRYSHPNLMAVIDLEGTSETDTLLVQECNPEIRGVDDGLLTDGVAAAVRQLMDALLYLHQRLEYHGCIRKEYITYLRTDAGLHFTLTGLWERTLQPDFQPTDKLGTNNVQNPQSPRPHQILPFVRQDIKTLGEVLLEAWRSSADGEDAFSFRNGEFPSLDDFEKPVDPLVYRVLQTMVCGGNEDALNVHDYLLRLTGGNDSPLFQTVSLTKIFTIGVDNFDKLHRDNVISFLTWLIKSGAYMCVPQKTQSGALLKLQRRRDQYISWNTFKPTATAFEGHLDWIREGLDRPERRLGKEISKEITVYVPWLRQCGMVNLNCLMNATDLVFESAIPTEHTIEVKGASKNAGVYVDITWLKKQRPEVCERLDFPTSSLEAERAQSIKRYQPKCFALFSTDLPWACLLVLRLPDLHTLWEPFCEVQACSPSQPTWSPLKKTFAECDACGLPDLKRDIESFIAPSTLDAAGACEPELPVGGEIASGDTSADTDSSDDGKFRRRKRRAR